MTHDHADASDASGGGFAAVLAALTPKTDVPDAKPHVAQSHHVEPRPDEPVRETAAPKIVRPVAPPVQKGDAKIPVQPKSHVAARPAPVAPQPSKDVEDEDASLVAPVRALPQARLVDKTASEIDPDTGHPVAKAAAPEQHQPDTAPRASVPKLAPPAVPAQDMPDSAANESVPAKQAAPSQRDAPAPTGTKVAQNVIDKIVAEAKTPAAAVDISKLVVPPKPAGKAAGKPDAKIQAAVARANVTVIDKAPAPAPQGAGRAALQIADKAAPQVAGKSAPQPKPDVQAQPRAQASEPAAPQAPAARSDAPAADAPAQQPNAPAPQQPTANAAIAVVATHAQTVSAPQLATTAAALAPAMPEPQQPNVAALAAAIAAKSGQGSKMFEIRLDPPELGRVDVHLSVSHDGKAEATLYAERPETVALLRGDSQNLERALKDAGLELSNSSLNFSLKGEQRQGDGGGASQAHTRNLSHAVVARSEAVNASLANLTQASADGRLDIRV